MIWTPEKVEQLLKLRAEGKTYNDCAVIFRIKPRQVKSQIEKMKRGSTSFKPLWSEWSEEETNKLIELHKQGYTSYMLMDALGKSRSAIMGRVARLQEKGILSKRYRPMKSFPSNSKPKSIVRGYFFNIKPRHEYTPAVRASVEELENNHCRYPIGELTDPDFRFCCAPKKAGSSYCEEHHAICWRPMPDDRRRAKEAVSLKAWRALASSGNW